MTICRHGNQVGMFLMLLCNVHRLLVEKLKKLGVPSGPLYGRLKKGEIIETPNGVKVREVM